MAPIDQTVSALVERAYYYDQYGNRRWRANRPWWIALVVAVPLFILLLLFIARRATLRRRNQGAQPLPYMGWTGYQFQGDNQQPYQPQYQQQQPYQQYDQNPQGEHYYKPEEDVQNAPPAYDRPPGPPPTSSGGTQAFDRPEGPPPGTTDYPTYPPESYKR